MGETIIASNFFLNTDWNGLDGLNGFNGFTGRGECALMRPTGLT